MADATAAIAAPVAVSSVLSEEVQSAFDYMPATLAGMIAGVGVVVLLFWQLSPPAVLLPWLAAFAVLWLFRLLMLRRFRRVLQIGVPNWLGWRRTWNLTTLFSGALWGLTAWLFYSSGGGIEQTGLIVIVYTYCISAVPVLANQPRIFVVFASLCFVPMIARIATGGDLYSYQLAGELLLVVSLTTLLARNYRQALQRVTELKLRSDGLLRQLRVEKRAAEAARHEAELANRAKTQFFAAASHDLRQPLHAMGLFAEALRQRTREPELARLVNSINESVDALEGLFSELLDITRIDSGGVEVRPDHFEAGDVLRKLRLHFEPAAFDKGLVLRLRGGHHVVHADPLLVERILRNLVANAIRYTEDGSVLVSCRRRGEIVRLEVWDTGIGIDESERSRVFEEFYQVPAQRPISADQRKGLGLGLAIVLRLAKLMGAALQLRSQPGRGTVFTLDLPLGQLASAVPRALKMRRPIDVTLDKRLVVIVEDDPAVREGLEMLLTGWGASLASFDSVAATQQWAAASDPAVVRPALAIVDYRLEHGRNGIDAIVSLRQRFGAELPAIVVTGSAMIGPEHETAQAHDFHLLVKPVLPNKLRAMISFKLGGRPAPAGRHG
ncbi:MAG: ATP-binding protein [Pseudomonadota bacterium]|nr:ATP-binding protein [Pseudomonadota bacterium]